MPGIKKARAGAGRRNTFPQDKDELQELTSRKGGKSPGNGTGPGKQNPPS